jgi:two-component system, cell cycle response regulator
LIQRLRPITLTERNSGALVLETLPKTILMVEDNAIMRRIQEAQLEPLGHRVVFAVNGQQALDKIAESEPDLILMDVVMPGMDGFKTCEAVKSNPRSQSIPVFVLTALKDAKDRSFLAGADDFMRKPASALLLQTRIQNHLLIHETKAPVQPGGKVLVISSNATIRAQVTNQLGEGGVALEASSESEAFACIASQALDLLVLDGALDASPVQDLVLRFRQTPTMARIPLLLIHGSEDLHLLEATTPPVDDFIEKPVHAKEVRHRVGLLLRLAFARKRLGA